MLRRFLAFAVLFCCIVVPVFCNADEMGEHILNSILTGKKPTDASLLLITRDLKWYEENMGRLPTGVQSRIQDLRIEVAGKSAQSAAVRMGEPEAIFGATGSWSPGRDMDMVYFGKNVEGARTQVKGAFEEITAGILSRNGPGDEILRSAAGMEIPGKLSTETLSLMVSDVPDFGYKDLERAYLSAKEAFARGESSDQVMKRLHDRVWESLGKNYEAHIASTAPDMYRGAGGQQWWSANYLENPQKMRTFMQDPATGAWSLKPGGLGAVPEEIAERIGFGAFKGKGSLKFSKIASDFAMFYKHESGGLSDTAKYVYRIWEDVDGRVITEAMTMEDVRPFVVANRIARDPKNASKILAEAGLTQEGLQKSLSGMLYRWTEKQLLVDTDTLVKEVASHLLSAPPSNMDDVIGDLVAKARLKFDLNDMANGLDILRQAPSDAQKRLIAALESNFGESDAGKIVIKYIKKQMRLLADVGGELTLRILKLMKDMGRIQDDQYRRAVKAFEETGELTDDVAVTVRKARKEVMLISSAGMFDVVDDPQALDRLMEQWRRFNSGAIIQSPNGELAAFRKEFRQLPEGELKRLGWTPDELRIPGGIKQKLPGGPGAVMQLESKLGGKLAQSGLSVRQFQSKLYEILFNPAYTQLGDPSISIGAFDAFVGVAMGLYMTYDIMFNQTGLTPEDENLQIGNAWVTAIPVVGDFAQGLISGGQAWYEGDKGKVLESGLWISIGVMGCVPGGQLPAVVAGISLATKPLVVGAYDARQAQNLIQAWVESGDWAMDQKPRRLKGLFDREKNVHAITYDDLLTGKGNKPYRSERADGLLGTDVTMNDSIRAYAEKDVFPQYPAIANLRDALKNLYPAFNDKDWTDEFTAKIMVESRGGKGGLALFRAYYLIRTRALEQTISQLKSWAEDEMRAAKDYDAEVKRLREELRRLESELKTGSLVQHADESVEAYSRVIKNVWEQESLPLSKLRIYEHYVKAYGEAAGKLRRVSDLFRECSSPYSPAGWYLTGYPEFDKGHVDNLLAGMENGRKGVIEHIEKLLKEMDQKNTRFNASDECHKKAFDVLAPFRYKVAFAEHLAAYFKQLVDGVSTWNSSYEAAKMRYNETRDRLTRTFKGTGVAIVEDTAFTNAFMTFVAAIPYNLASKEAGMYRSSASDFETRKKEAMKEYDMAGWRTGEGGKALETCLLGGLKIRINLSNSQPEAGKTIEAQASLESGTPPKDHYWYWKTAGGLKAASPAGPAISVKVESAGTLTAQLLDHFDLKKARVLAEASLPVTPKKGEGTTGEPGSGPGGTPSDPRSQAEAKYQWLKDSVVYLDALRELDRKTFVAFKNGVTSALVRQFTASNPAGYDDSAALPDCAGITDSPIRQAECFAAREAGCGQSVGDARRLGAQYGRDCLSVLEKSCVTVKTVRTKKRVDGKEVEVEEPVTNCDIVCGKSRACDRVFMTYSGRAGYANDVQAYVNENWLRCMGDAETANGRHQKELSAKISGLPGTLPYNRWQEYKGMSMWKDYLAAAEKVKQEYGLPEPIPAAPSLPWNYSSPCGGAGGLIPGSTALQVSLKKNPEKGNYKPGELVKVSAQVSGGKPPYAVTWTGDHEGKDADVTFASRKGGAHRLAVDVRDSAGAVGKAEITITIGAVRAVIENVPKKPVYGTWLYPRARIEGISGKEKDYRVIWQSDKSLTFHGRKDPFESGVRVDAMGPIKIWAEIQQAAGEKVYDTVGETAQEVLQVERPQFTLVYDPPKARLGQEAKVTIRTTPDKIDDLIRYEWSSPESGKRMEYEKNARVIGFVPRDPKPFKLIVQPLTSRAGEYIGGAIAGEYQAEAYRVAVGNPRYLQSKPQIWKCDTQLGGAQKCRLYEVEYEFAVHHNIFMKVEVSPAPPETPRFRWTMAPEGCRIHNETSQDLTFDCGKTGSFTASVEVRDKNDIVLGGGSAQVSITISDDTLKNSKKKADETVGKEKAVRAANEKVAAGKLKVRQGKLDEGIADLDEAAGIDPANAEAKPLAERTRKEKQRALDQVGKARTLMGENRFPDAQRELIVAKNLHGLYPPVLEADRELGDKWRAYDGQVRDKIYEVRSASEKKEFGRALEIAAAWRASTKLDAYAEKALKEQEDWARKWKAEKDRQIGILKAAGEKVKAYEYAGALKTYDEGFANGQNIYNGTEPEYKEAIELRGEAFTKNKRLGELSPVIRDAAENRDAYYNQNHVLEGALKAADEAITLQPTNEQLKKWREQIVARAGKTKADNERIAAGRKHLDAARNAENGFLSQDSYIRGGSGRWSESIEGQMQANLAKAIENYRESLKYIPDAAVEKHIRELEANLDARKKFAENVRLSKELRAEGDTLVREARSEASFEASQEKFTKAIEKYNQSLGLYRPPDETTLRQIIHGAGMEKLSRAFRKFYTDCGTLEREGKIVEALAACEKAVENRYPGVHQGEWILLGGQVQNLRSRVAHARKMRAQGESEERARKIAEAVASYRDSLKNVPDPPLEEHVKALEARLGEANRGKTTADNLWQEGTVLYNQGRPSDSLTKFKESLGYWSDALRAKYVADLEARRAKASALREEGSRLQGQNRISEAVAKYKESLNIWPDTGLSSHIATLEGKLKQDADTAARKVRAKQLRDEGYALQQKNQIQAAVGKYKESLAILPDRQLEDYIRQLEARVAVVPPVKGDSVQKPPMPPVSSAAWSGAWRSDPGPGGETLSMNLTQSGNRVSGTYRVDEPGGRRIAEGTVEGSLSGSSLSGTFRASGVSGTMEGTLESGGVSSTVVMRSGQDSDRYRLRRSGGSGQVTQPASSPMSAASQKTVVAEITNKSNQNTHIFPDGETFSPSNRLVPGEKRKVNVAMKADGSVVFKAGRNGQVMATKTWRGDPGDSSRVPVVVFDDTNPFDKLTVVTGLR